MKEIMKFESREEFRKWLNEHCMSNDGIWLLFGKAGGPKTIKAGEALEEALCFGWIDGQMQRINDKTYKKYFSMRRENSKWSEKNKALVKKLEEQGIMTDFGRKKIEEAKKMVSGTHQNPWRLQRNKLRIYLHCWKDMSPPSQILGQCLYRSKKPIRGHILTQRQMPGGKSE